MKNQQNKMFIPVLIASLMMQLCCVALSENVTVTDVNDSKTDSGFVNKDGERFLPAPMESSPQSETVSVPQEKNKNKKKKASKDSQNSDSVEIISDFMDYFPEENKIVASGNASATPEDKLSKLKADKITFYRETNILVAEGNVRIIKDNKIVYGSFMRVDLNKDTGFMANPRTGNSMIRVVAKEGYVYSKDMEFIKGRAKVADGVSYILGTNSIKTGFEQLDQKRMLDLSKSPEYLASSRAKAFKIKAKEIIVESGKDRNDIILKNASIYKSKKRVASVSKMVLSGDSKFSEIESTFPEVGYFRQMGLYGGPSWILNGPFNSTMKVAPLLTYDDSSETRSQGKGGMGIGGLARFRTSSNVTEMAYGTSKEYFILNGRQEFKDPRFVFNYANNYFVDDWFMGRKLPKSFGELEFRDSADIDDLGLVYRYKYGLQVGSDYTVGNSGDWRMNSSAARNNLPTHNENWSTPKLKAQGEFSRQKPLYEKEDYLTLNWLAQYDINQYGTGDTYTILRTGPTVLFTPNDRFRFRTTYYSSAIQGKSPLAWDQYYFGKQCVNVGYEYQITKKLAFGAVNTFNLLKDNFDERLLAENKWFVKYGPEDFKFCFSYDTVWRRTMMGVNMLVGSEKSDIEFDNLKVKDFKKLKKQQEVAKEKEKRNKKIRKQEELL